MYYAVLFKLCKYLSGTDSLTIRGVGVEDSGQYQCVAGNEEEESQAVASLVLGGSTLPYIVSANTLNLILAICLPWLQFPIQLEALLLQ